MPHSNRSNDLFHDTWQHALSHAVTDFSELCELLALDSCAFSSIVDAQKSFALRVPRAFVARMEKGNPNDPLLLQVLPQARETQIFPGFDADPVREQDKNPVPGLLHKYPGRVLLTLTGACAINCRYCFRRHFPYSDNNPGRMHWQPILDYIADDDAIEEVIFSGGDPLVLKDDLLIGFIKKVSDIKHVKRLRIHTRLPIVIPQRVTDVFIAALTDSRLKTIIVLHANHPNEIDDAVIRAIKKFCNAHITVLNQSVLLKNINDNADVLAQLSQRLFEAGVLPYYLHLLDKVKGAAHFDVSQETAERIMEQLKTQLPGYLVPKLAREAPGLLHKIF